MTQYIVAYIATAIIFLAIDAVWLGVVATTFYKSELGDLMADNVNFTAAGGFYLMYCVGIVIFAISPALRSGAWTDAALYGALFGFFCYATYDMTNIATIRDWPVRMSIVDMAWGTALTGVSATLGYLVTKWLT